MFDEGLAEQFREGQLDLVLDHAGDLQLPVVRVDRRWRECGVDPVEVRIGGDQRRDAFDVQGRASRHSRGGDRWLGQRELRADIGDHRGRRVDEARARSHDHGCRTRNYREHEEAPALELGCGHRAFWNTAPLRGGRPPVRQPLDQDAEHHDAGDRADDGGDTVEAGRTGAGHHRDEGEQRADPEEHDPPRRLQRFEHPGKCRENQQNHGHEREQGRLVPGAEQSDHEVFGTRRGQVDHQRADGEERAACGADEDREDFGDTENDSGGDDSGQRGPEACGAGAHAVTRIIARSSSLRQAETAVGFPTGSRQPARNSSREMTRTLNSRDPSPQSSTDHQDRSRSTGIRRE